MRSFTRSGALSPYSPDTFDPLVLSKIGKETVFMFKRLLLIAIFIFSLSPAMALDRILSPEEEQIIRDIGTHNSAIRTMVGRFLQIDTVGNRTEGTFFLERPNKIRFRYAPPSREEILSLGKGFYIIDRREKTQYAYPQNQVPLRQFLQEEIDLFSANIVDVVSSEDFISITISDDTIVGVVEVTLIFELASKELRQWSLTEPSGAELTFSLYDVENNVEIPKAFFFFPSGLSPKVR